MLEGSEVDSLNGYSKSMSFDSDNTMNMKNDWVNNNYPAGEHGFKAKVKNGPDAGEPDPFGLFSARGKRFNYGSFGWR
ncbi:MAG TPA: hypothetical protein DD706_01515 [Nitrospiraceae bacterium]|nr:hypothetical protein [Nitrospiraceae bacterium]